MICAIVHLNIISFFLVKFCAVLRRGDENISQKHATCTKLMNSRKSGELQANPGQKVETRRISLK